MYHIYVFMLEICSRHLSACLVLPIVLVSVSLIRLAMPARALCGVIDLPKKATQFSSLSLATVPSDDLQQLCESGIDMTDFATIQDLHWRSLDEATEPIEKLHSWMVDTCANPKLHMGSSIYCWESLYYIIHNFEVLDVEAKLSHLELQPIMLFLVNNVFEQESQLIAFR